MDGEVVPVPKMRPDMAQFQTQNALGGVHAAVK